MNLLFESLVFSVHSFMLLKFDTPTFWTTTPSPVFLLEENQTKEEAQNLLLDVVSGPECGSNKVC